MDLFLLLRSGKLVVGYLGCTPLITIPLRAYYPGVLVHTPYIPLRK